MHVEPVDTKIDQQDGRHAIGMRQTCMKLGQQDGGLFISHEEDDVLVSKGMKGKKV